VKKGKTPMAKISSQMTRGARLHPAAQPS